MSNYWQITLEEALKSDKAYKPIRKQMYRYAGLGYMYYCQICNAVVGSEIDGRWVGDKREKCKNGHKIDWSN